MNTPAAKVTVITVLFLGAQALLAQDHGVDRATAEPPPVAPAPVVDHMMQLFRGSSPESMQACTVSSLTLGTQVSGQLDSSDCALTSSYADFWGFAGTSGQHLTVTYTSAALSPLLGTVQDGSSGNVLATDNGASPLVFEYTLPQTANYAVGLTTLKSGFATGSYTLLVTASTGGGGGTPNLVPYTPSGWTGSIVVSNITGTHADAAGISTADTVYVDYAFRNLDSGAISASFVNDLYLDGNLVRQGTAAGLPSNNYGGLDDYSVGHLTAGAHTLRLKIDANNSVSETDETDNEYVKTFTVSSGGGAGTCTPTNTTLCLSGGRFRVTADYRNQFGSGAGTAVSLSDATGFYTFDNPDSVELVVKVLNACSFTPNIWVFAGGLTDQEVNLIVTDTRTNTQRIYFSPLGTKFVTVTDTSAFATCP